MGSRGDSYDNALAETINGLYKAELINRRAPWKTKEAWNWRPWNGWSGPTITDFATRFGFIPSAEAEVNYYRQLAERNETEVST